MITRYTLPRMGRIWSEENKFTSWLKIELAACEAQTQLKLIPRKDLARIKRRARFTLSRINQLEARLHHDVIAFLTAVNEHIGPSGRYVHFGLTSSDILDTSLAWRMTQAADVLRDDLTSLSKVLKSKARRYRHTFMAGRTHGIHAEPVTLGLKFLVFFDELQRDLKRLRTAREEIRVGKLSGAVGTYAQVDPFVEKYVCKQLGLVPARTATQVIQRDHHAAFLSTLAVIGSTLEKIATEIRNLQRTDIGEVREPFGKGQKGSSAMPHKQNPIICERVAGLARILRGNAMAALENVALWHERDITHSSVERVIIPDSTILLDYMAVKLCDVIRGLVVLPERMKQNLDRNRGLVFSQSVLLALVRAGLSREDAYAVVQKQAMRVIKLDIDFKSALLSEPRVRSLLGARKVGELCKLETYGKKINRIFRRFGL